MQNQWLCAPSLCVASLNKYLFSSISSPTLFPGGKYHELKNLKDHSWKTHLFNQIMHSAMENLI